MKMYEAGEKSKENGEETKKMKERRRYRYEIIKKYIFWKNKRRYR